MCAGLPRTFNCRITSQPVFVSSASQDLAAHEWHDCQGREYIANAPPCIITDDNDACVDGDSCLAHKQHPAVDFLLALHYVRSASHTNGEDVFSRKHPTEAMYVGTGDKSAGG